MKYIAPCRFLAKNLDLARKELTLAESSDIQLAEHLVGNALENAVSAFDGYGREVCSQRGSDIRFQTLAAARKKVQETFGFDFIDVLGSGEWEFVCRAFQKRHLLAHKMGVIDEECLKKANDPYCSNGTQGPCDP